MAKRLRKVYGYELRIGDSIAVKFNEKSGRIIRSVEVVSIDPPSRRFGGHRHTGHIHVNMREGDQASGCYDMFAFVPLAVE